MGHIDDPRSRTGHGMVDATRVTPLRGALARRRASEAQSRRPTPSGAVDAALAVVDFDAAARLITQSWPLVHDGGIDDVERWLAPFDDEALLRRHPGIGALGVWVHAVRGRPTAAVRWARTVVAASPLDGGPSSAAAAPHTHPALLRSILCEGTIEDMQADSATAVAELSSFSPWWPLALLVHGVAALLSGQLETAEAMLADAAEGAAAAGARELQVLALAERALIAFDRDQPAQARPLVRAADEPMRAGGLAGYASTCLLLAVRARLWLRLGDPGSARRDLRHAERLRPQLTHAIPWLAVQTRIHLAYAEVALADARRARTLVREIDDVLVRRPHLRPLRVSTERLRAQLAIVEHDGDGWASTLTTAELRLLPMLATHLTFGQIGRRLFVSRNTVKTQAVSTYRKLGVASRSEAVEAALRIGLLDESGSVRRMRAG